MVLRLSRLRSASVVALAASATLAGCAIGPNYKRPATDTGIAFKEAAGWKQAQPSDALDRGDWWTIFNDPVLNDLEKKVEVSNENLIAAEASYREAKALVEETQSTIFPQVTGTGSVIRSKNASVVSTNAGTGTTVTLPGANETTYTARATASWQIDVWGQIRREIEAAKDQAKASEIDIANAKLSAQITLATDYVQLREQDEQKRLLDNTVAGYARTLEITNNKYKAGVSAQTDVLTAQAQLQSAQAEAVDLARTRAALEHAIAVLTGQPPSAVSITLANWTFTVPDIPVGMPSSLLERRPDVAASERVMAAANAQIGVNMAGFFPAVNLSGTDGFSSNTLSNLISAPNNAWSIGPTITQTLFDAGATQGRVRAAQATYQQDVAQYRQTVLTALQQVEDAVAALRVLQPEEQFLQSASQAADQAEQNTLNEYNAGTVDYTTVVVAQNTALSARVSALQSRLQRLENTINLISALGGGWQEKKDRWG